MKYMMQAAGSRVNFLDNAVLMLAMKRIPGVNDGMPFMKARRVTSADEVLIYNFRDNAGTLQYLPHSLNGSWADFDEQMFDVEWYSQNVIPGSDLATNGSFTSWTGDNPDGYTVSNEDASNYITESSGGGAARIVSDNTEAVAITQTYILNAGEYYKFSITKQNTSSGDVRLSITDSGGTILAAKNMGWSTDGEYSWIFKTNTGTNTTIYIYRDNTGNTDYEFTGWTLENVHGDHAYQATAAKQPEILWTASTPYPYLGFSSTGPRYLIIDDSTSLNPSVGSIYAHFYSENNNTRERIVGKQITDVTYAGWFIEKQADNTARFRQISTLAVEYDTDSTNDVSLVAYNNVVAVVYGAKQLINLDGDYNEITGPGELVSTAAKIGIGIRAANEAIPMDGRINAIFMYNVIISDQFVAALFSEDW